MPFVDSFAHFFYAYSNHNVVPVRQYVQGLMQGKVGSKNLERIDEAVQGSNYQSLHHKISTSPWEARPLMDEIARQADGLLGGGTRSRLVIDDTGIAKKGLKSVGVARQYSGRAGKIDNCQIAVCASLASGQHSCLNDIRLHLPQEWCDDPARCATAGVPSTEQHFRSKSAIALEMILHQRALGIRFDVVSFDSGYGSQTPLLHDLDSVGETFVGEVHCDQHILTCGDIVFMLAKLLPDKARGRPDVEVCRKLLEKRLAQRQKDQDRRKRMNEKNRPPLLPDEIAPE